VYNMHDAVRLRGHIDAEILEAVFCRLTARHEALRTSFVVVDGSPIQVIADTVNLELPIEDLRGMSPELREVRAYEIAAEESRRPFDIEQAPLFRTRLIRIDDHDHILMWTMHHMISDGWSLGIIIKEVMVLCESMSRNLPDALPPPALQYGDYSAWQEQWLTGEVLDKQLSFWRKELAEEIPPLDLHVGIRPPFPTYSGKRCVTTYPLALTEDLKQLALREGATLFMVLLGAFDVLLYRYTGLERICVGVPVANRNRAELEDVIGFFANTLPICADLGANQTFLMLLEQLRKRLHAAYNHQDVPFERLVEELKPRREVNRTPFFQVMFVLQNEPMPSIDQPGLQICPFELHNSTSKFDLLMNIFETAEGISLGIEYSDDLFDRDAIDRIMRHYLRLLESIAAHPDQSISALLMLDDEERKQIVQGWNQTAVSYDTGCTSLHQLIEAQVERTPNAYALAYGSERLTYAELNGRANRLANFLRDFNLPAESLVAVYMGRSIELAVALLAVLKAGFAYVPLDVEYPPDRLRYMLEDSQAPLLIYAGDVPVWTDGVTTNAINIIHAESVAATGSGNNLRLNVAADALAYVIYTSGSTGRPKGAMNTHGGICNRLLWMQDQYGLKEDDRVLQKTPIGFDVSVWEVFWPWITGAELVMGAPGLHRDSAWLAKTIREEQITTIHFVPSMLRIFVLDKTSRGCDSLKRVICSGEALPFDLQVQFQAAFDVKLHNLYGPTEAAVDVTYWDCSHQFERSVVPIGRPIANTQIYILDQLLQPVPVGVPGELYIGGRAVGRGYLNRKVLTAERFIPDPFSTESTARLYKTGDLARFANDGVIEFLGRIDGQVKLRGMRIELAEIEHALVRDAEVQEATVLLREDTPGDPRLVAYVVPGEKDLTPESTGSESERVVHDWELVFDDTYTRSEVKPGRRQDFSGWHSSFTGDPIDEIDMREWVDSTIKRIREKSPSSILEIGCGSGLLLLPLVRDCKTYVGIDISAAALSKLEEVLRANGEDNSKVTLLQGAAHNLKRLQPATFDTVILNSVVQYFPSVEYLREVIENVLLLLKPGGAIFLGDLRNYDLDEAFAAAVEAHRAGEEMLVEELRERVGYRIAHDRELTVSPHLFARFQTEMQGLPRVEMHLRRGSSEAEMCRYRYDVWLCTSEEPTRSAVLEKQPYSRFSSNLQATLEKGADYPFVVTCIPNRRVWCDVQLARLLKEAAPSELVSSCKQSLECVTAQEPVDPEALIATWQGRYRVYVNWAASGDPREFDALFVPETVQGSAPEAYFAVPLAFSSLTPRRGQLGSNPGRKRKESDHLTIIKDRLRQTLPDYMIPAAYVFLEALPLSSNGKIDRRALPAPLAGHIPSGSEFVEPQSRLEVRLAGIWCELLGVTRVGTKSNFFDIGGHSLLAARLVFRIREEFGREIPLRVLFDNPTLEGMCIQVEEFSLSKSDQANLTSVEMVKDSFLPASIKATSPYTATKQVKSIFLTGATGFLGAYLLRDLLRHTTAEIVCLVRAEEAAAGMYRLRAVLKDYGLVDEIDFGRVTILLGDLARHRFGLTQREFQNLAEKSDAIYHCGAAVNFVAPYSTLRDANVAGTVETLKLAGLQHTKPVHFISSVYTLVDADRTGPSLVEQDLPRNAKGLRMGYLQTKWVAERLAEAARNRGIPVNIYRPGRICGDSATGACQQEDFYWGFLGACLKMGSAPMPFPDENMVPADYASESIVKLAQDTDRVNQTYHIVNREPLAGARLLEMVRQFGYNLRSVPYADWREAVSLHVQNDPANASSKFAGLLFDGEGVESEPEPMFSAPLTWGLLDEMGVECPGINAALVNKYLQFFVDSGLYPEP
jgi:amino acid adenylation domain-containing protein/thioester reductase-like protein